jgi:hypothetical protein
LCYTTEREITILEATGVITRHNRYHCFLQLMRKTKQSFTSTAKAVTYIVGYVDDLIVADISNQNDVSKQIMEFIQKYWKVSDEGTSSLTLPYPLPTSPNIPMPTDWHVMPSDWDDYTLDIKLLKLVNEAYRVMGYLVGTPNFNICYKRATDNTR